MASSSSAAPPPRPVVICGPSGVGKGTLIELLQKSFPPDKFGFSVSHTTRKPREGEEDGVHYNFTSVEQIKAEIDAGKFVEYAEVHGNYYGTRCVRNIAELSLSSFGDLIVTYKRSVKAVKSVQNQNLICLLDIDVQGAQNVKKSSLDAYYLFIAPPSMEELEKRLRGRGTEKEEAIQRRLANAKGELDYGMVKGNFDAVLVNKDLDRTLEKMVRRFKAWYPELLGDGKTNGSSGMAPAEEEVPPPIVDPLSFPKTDEGLQALLVEIDRDCPLEGQARREMTYHGSDIHVAAGKTLDIPLPPVEQDGSKIEWSVTLVDEYSEGLDIEFGLVVIVAGEEVQAREMGRILGPPDDGDDGEKVSAKGKFTVANSAPVTVVIKLDNSYSWIKPKTVNWSFTVIGPVDDNMIQRSLRAMSVLPRILEGQKALTAAKAKETSRMEALGRIQQEMDGKMSGLNKQIDYNKAAIEALKQQADEAEEEAKVKQSEIKEALSNAKKEEQSIDQVTADIIALEEECARLKKMWEQLKVERAAREGERLRNETKAEESKEERIKLQEEIATKKSEEQSKLRDIESVEKERSVLQGNLDNLEQEKKARKAEEDKYSNELAFLQRQMEAVQLRFIDRKK
ncbi:hypothetical protein ACHAXT_003553 [Thalassiosira profunda]